MLKLLIWKLPSAWVSFVIFFPSTPSIAKSHQDRLSHCCHLPEAHSPNVNTIFSGAVKMTPDNNLLTLQGEPEVAQNLECVPRAGPLFSILSSSCSQIVRSQIIWVLQIIPLPTPISHCLNINGKQFNGAKGAAFAHVPIK